MKPKTSSFTPAVAAALLLFGTSAVRAEPSPVSTGPAPSPTPSLSESTAPRRNRAVSPEVAASLAAAMPKYSPPKPVEKKPVVEEEKPDLRETDKPKNGIVRLPNYVVREQRAPILNERDVYTEKGLQALARKRYLTDADQALNRFRIPLFSPISVGGSSSGNATTDRAMLMYSEDERLKNMATLKDDAGLVSARDKAAGAYIKREADKINTRTDDFGWSSKK